MRFIKKWNQIFESSYDDFFNQISIKKDDISDVFAELVDLGYELKFSGYYLTKTGHTFKTKKGIVDYYPVIHLSLGKFIPDDYGDATNWSGGVYYDDKEEVLDTLSSSVSMLRSMLKESAKVLVSVRSMSDINIRIVLPFQSEDNVISLEFIDDCLVKIINKYRGYNDNPVDFTNLINLYQTDFISNTILSSRSFDITPIFDRGPLNTEEPSTTGDFIISKMLTDNDSDNISQLNSIFGIIVREFLESITKDYPNIVLKTDSRGYKFYSRGEDKPILSIEHSLEEIKSGNIFIGKKTILRKRKTIHITIYKMDINIKYNRE